MSQFDALEFAEVEVPPVLAAQIPGTCGPDPAAIGRAMRTTFEQLGAFLPQHALVPSGPPRSIYTSYDPDGVKFVVAMPVAAPAPIPIEGGAGSVEFLPGAKTLRFTHRGPYPNLMMTYGRITEFLKSKGLMKTEADWARYMPMWEEYLNDPHTTPEAELVTYIYLPVP
ncbi:MAG: GyrI-like domain-containing protein [Planctomycetes bacterium]|jgi:effector-binding domain-containing protein|nr:GyrI-like domain-containing protein [Planctomycetota bacterium]